MDRQHRALRLVLAGSATAVLFAGQAIGQPIIEPTLELSASDADFELNFGIDVALSGDRILVGSDEVFDPPDNPAGAAYIFDATTGVELHRIESSRGEVEFGRYVAMNNDFAAVGTGRANVYVFDVVTGDELYQIDFVIPGRVVAGTSLSMHDGRLAIDVFVPDSGDTPFVTVLDVATGTHVSTLEPGFTVDDPLTTLRVALHGEIAAVVADPGRSDQSSPPDLFIFDSTSGKQLHQIELPPIGDVNWGGTMDVATNGDVVVVGDPRCCDQISPRGRVYIYDVATAGLLATLTEPDICDNLYFGGRVALAGDALFVAGRKVGPPGGCTTEAYHFVYDIGTMELVGLLTSDGLTSAAFDGTRAVIGDIANDFFELGGGALVYELPNFICPADTNNDGVVSPADFNAWILAFNNGDPACNQNNDGLCTPADFNAWIINYNAGCD